MVRRDDRTKELIRAYEERHGLGNGGALEKTVAPHQKSPRVSGPPRIIENPQGEIPDEREGLLERVMDSYLSKKGRKSKKHSGQGELRIGQNGKVYLNGQELNEKKRKKLGIMTSGDIIDSAINSGLVSIAKSHPYFSGGEEGAKFVSYLSKHLDYDRIREKYKSLEGRAPEEVIAALARYVASPGAFDVVGQRVLLRNGLEEKVAGANTKSWLRFVPFTKERQYAKDSATTKYLDKAINAFGELYSFFESVKTPESFRPIKGAIEEVYSAGLMEAAAGLLFEKDLIDAKKYRGIRDLAKRAVSEGTGYVSSNITDYLSKVGERLAPLAQKVAASLFGISGLGLLIASSLKLTGNAVGNSNFYPSAGLSVFAGVLLIIIAFLLFKLKRKKKVQMRNALQKKTSKKMKRKKRI